MKPYRERDRGRESGGSFRGERERDRGERGDRADRDRDAPAHFPYGRPSVSAWVAAASVAFAVFLLGGFIKTYRQLDLLREESRLEIAELRNAMRLLQARLSAVPAAPAPARSRLPSINDTAAARQERPQSAPVPAPPPRFEPLVPVASVPQPEDDGLRYQWGRTSGAPASRALVTVTGGQSQVVSVSGENKRVMIEGGRDVELAEGARLELCRDGRWIADLRVQDVFGNQSLCEVLHATHPPRPGDTVRLPEKSM